MADISVDFGGFESLLEVVVDSFIRDLAEKGQVGDADLFLLRRLERCLLRLRGAAPAALGGPRSLVFGTPCYTLYDSMLDKRHFSRSQVEG